MSELDKYPLLYESYSKSSEVSVSGAKKVTQLLIILMKMDATETERAEGKTYPVGTVIRVRTNLQWQSAVGPPPVWSPVSGKDINFYRSIAGGAYSKIATVKTDINGIASLDVALQAGINKFYGEFTGDTEYEGCSEAKLAFAY